MPEHDPPNIVHLSHSQAGEFVSGLFYKFDMLPPLLFPDKPPDGTITAAEFRSDRPGEVSVSYVDAYKGVSREKPCPECKHVPWGPYSEVQGDLFGGWIVPPFQFLLDGAANAFVASRSLRDAFAATSFRGIEFVPMNVVVNQCQIDPAPELFSMEFIGRSLQRRPILQGAPNECPFCGHAPALCGTCGKLLDICPDCRRWAIIGYNRADGTDDKRLRCKLAWPEGQEVLDGDRWDGSDGFMMVNGGRYVSRRVIDWLLARHAAPFIAYPTRVDVSKCTPEQRKALDALKSPPGQST